MIAVLAAALDGGDCGLLAAWPTWLCRPAPLYNPLTSPTPLSPLEILSGPFGLLAYLPLVPLVLLAARRFPRAALSLSSLIWLLATLHWRATLVLLGGLAIACAWLLLLAQRRRRGTLSERGMIAAVWVGLHVLILPLWWQIHDAWYPSRMAILHAAGVAYFLLRLIGWGVTLAKDPHQPVCLRETICWLLYAPAMRLGPLMAREEFLRRLTAWEPRRAPAWLDGAKRFGLFLLGGAVLGVVSHQIPRPITGADFFAAPEQYRTAQLLRAAYLVPIHVYLLLWTYNELAAALGCWIGIRVDNNFNWLPLATSVRDFWHRWHITLGAWLRDHIYIPLGGNRRHVALNYAAVFGYCGVWHGASWSFIAWGLSQAAVLVVQRAWDRLRRGRPQSGARGIRIGRVAWTGLCWILTMHYQIATIVVFADFEHCGWRLFRELWRRLPC